MNSMTARGKRNLVSNRKNEANPKRACTRTTQKRLSTARSLSYSNDSVEKDEDESSDEEYEVEAVLDENDHGEVLVKWVGYSETTWEPLGEIPRNYYTKYLKSKREKNSTKDDRGDEIASSKQSRSVKIPDLFNQATPDDHDCENDSNKSVAEEEPCLLPAREQVNICKICNDEENGGRFCATCNDSVHHMCWNQVCHTENLEEENDVCYCSLQCYKSCHPTQSMEGDVAREPPQDTHSVAKPCSNTKLLRLCVVCDEVDRGAKGCASCRNPVHRECSNEIVEELEVKDGRNMLFCSAKCYEKWRQDLERLKTSRSQAKVPRKKAPKAPRSSVMKKKANASQSPSTCEVEDVVGHNVAFSPSNEDWLSSRDYSAVGSLFLAGVVTRQIRDSKSKLVPDKYQIQWTATEFQGKDHTHVISLAKVIEGKQNYDRMMGGHLKSASWDRLCMPLGDNISIDADWDEFDELDESLVRYDSNSVLPIDLAEVEKMQSMDFKTEAHIESPNNLYRHEDGSISTRLIPEHRSLFEHSASSAFFALLPLAFWRKVVENTNQYAANSKQPRVTLEEMMKFLGILFYISTVDKGEYSNYWGDQIENRMFGEMSSGLDRVMPLRRFKFIRQNLSFRNGVTKEELKSDPAARIRPLINVLKSRAPKFVQLGRNVAVDESSIACRSKYGRHMIVYNATKPTGKYHFKIYMMCCSETWYAVSFKLHCSSELDQRLSGVVDNSQINSFRDATQTTKPLRQHVLEVVMPIYYTNRIINTDNYYTSVQLLEALRVVGLYGRGTIRSDSKFGPKSIMLKKTDQVERGTIRQGVDTKHNMIGASWCDGSIVNMLSTADASTTTTVERTIGREKIAFPAPTCIREYNQFMQGVDRIDQLRGRFSIADGHTFKKWHKKLGMAEIDIAVCNAYIARKITGAYKNARDPHREFMIELSSELIHGDWTTALGDNGLLFSQPKPTQAAQGTSQSPRASSPRPPSPGRVSIECTFQNSKNVFPTKRHPRECVVCRFEGRYPSEQTVYCNHHKVAVCSSVRECEQVHSYMCPDSTQTCWAKFHSFYFPAGLFNVNGNIRRSCSLFQEMKRSQVRSRVPPTIDEDQEVALSNVANTLRTNRSILHRNDSFSSDSSSEPTTPLRIYQPGDSISDHSSIDFGVSPVTAPVQLQPSNTVTYIRVGSIVQL